MKGLFIFSVLLTLLFCTPAFADFEKGWDALNSGDYATALKELRPLAEKGDRFAQFLLGDMYDRGEGVTQDYSAAVKWYKLAAEQEFVSAQYEQECLPGSGATTQGIVPGVAGLAVP